MTNRVQVLRSTVAGNRPTGRLPGELYVNWPDKQFGAIDSGGAALDLVAVRYFSSTTTYAVGDHVVQGGKIYRCVSAVMTPGAFNGAYWNAIASTADLTTLPYLPLAGGTLTGALTLAADPGAALGAATKQYVDNKASSTAPVMDGIAAVGVGATFARADHVHPSDTSRLALAGGTLTGNIVVSTATWPSLSLKAATAGSGRQLLGYTGNNLRWEMDLGDSVAESGSNAGSNFALSAYSDAGAFVSAPLTISRNNGFAYFNGVGATPFAAEAAAPGNAAIRLNKASGAFVNVLTSAVNGLFRWNLVLGSGTAESGSNAGSDFQINSYSDAGGFIGMPLTINRATGYATFAAGITASGLFVPNPGQITLRGSAQPAVLFQNNAGTLVGQCYWQATTVGLYNSAGASSTAALNASGQWQTGIHYNTTSAAYMAGGTLWQNTSDERIKNVVGEYTLGLDEVLRLRPIIYTFKGNDTWTDDLAYYPLKTDPDGPEPEAVRSKTGAAPYPGSLHHDYAVEGREFVGFIAQEVETILPGAVSKRKGYIDGVGVSDMRDLNLHELLFALVNSVKTLAARVEALEAA